MLALFVFLANVYGFNNHTQNSSFFHDLSSKIFDLKSKYPSAAVIVGGDFNEAPDLCMDRFPSKPESRRCNTIINDFCNFRSLLDAYRFMHADADLLRKSRIDYWLISDFMSLLLNPVISVLLLSQIMLLSILFYLILVLVLIEILDTGN